MPRIPIIKTKFPSQAYMQTKGPRVGSTRRFRYDPGRDDYIYLMKGPDNLWWETKYEPLQGPELPRDVEKYRQQMIDAMESGNTRRVLSRTRAYEAAVAEERARQAYNRRVAAWNEYQNLPEIERRFWANKNQIRNHLIAEFQDSPYDIEDYMTSYRGPYDFVKLNSPEERFNYFDYPMLKSFDDFPKDLADMPWNR